MSTPADPQIDAARKLGLDVHVMNGEALDFDSEFDAVFSNAALHWMSNPAKVIAGVRRALKPHGRFVAEFGGHGCVAKIRKALVEALNRRSINGEAASPWYFPTVEDYSQQLTRGGFVVSYIALIPRPTPLPEISPAGWKPSPRVSLHPCRPPNDPPISLKSEKPCAPALRRRGKVDRRLRPPPLQRQQGPLTDRCRHNLPGLASLRVPLSWLRGRHPDDLRVINPQFASSSSCFIWGTMFNSVQKRYTLPLILVIT